MALLGKLSVVLEAEIRGFSEQIDRAVSQLDEFAASASSIAIGAGVAIAAMAVPMNSFLGAASDATETINLIDVAYGDMAESVKKWSGVIGKEVGRNSGDILRYAGSMQSMLKPMVGSEKAAAQMSTALTELAIDMASFNNAVDADMLTALRAGISGETEPLKRFGVVMTEANLAAFALSRGIKDNIQTMSVAQKTALRYEFILANTSMQQGDAARTAGTYANQMKALEGAWGELRGSIGAVFINNATSALNAMVRTMRDAKIAVDGLGPEAKLLLNGMAGLAAVTLPAIAGIAGVSAAAAKLSSAAIKGARGSISLIVALGKIGVVAAGVVFSVWALKSAFDKLVEAIGPSAIGSITNGLQKFFGVIADGANKLLQATSAIVLFTAANAGLMDQKEAKGMMDIMDKEGTHLFSSPTEALGESFKKIGEDLKDDFSGAGKALMGMMEKVSSFTSKSMDKSMDKIKSKMFDDIKDMMAFVTGSRQRREGIDFGAEVKAPSVTTEDVFGRFDFSSEDFAAEFTSVGRQIGREVSDSLQIWMTPEPVSKEFEAAANELAVAHNAIGVVADAMQSKAPEMGAAINAFAQGFAAGGPIGGVVAAIASVITGTETFARVMESVNSIITDIQGLFDDFFQPVAEIIEAITPLIKVLTRMALLFNLANITTMAVTRVLERVAKIANDFVGGVVDAWNKLVENLAKVLDKIGLGNHARRLKLSLEEDASQIARMMEGVSSNFKEMERSSANIPQNYKLARDRFDAMTGQDQLAGSSYAGPSLAAQTAERVAGMGFTPGGSAISQFVIQSMSVASGDPQEFARALQEEVQWTSRTTGSRGSAGGTGGDFLGGAALQQA